MRRLLVLIALAILLIEPTSVVRSASPRPGMQDSAGDQWTARLESLRPQHPMGYFELAEEVADQASDETELQLARRLYALAAMLDTTHLGSSAFLAMADLETQPHVKRRLLAMASLLGNTTNRVKLFRSGPQEKISTEVALHVAEAFSYYRRGLGSKALKSLSEPGAMELLESIDALIRGGSKRFIEDCRLYNDRDRPTLSEPIRTKMMRLEQALLAGEDRRWSGELLLTEGAPLIEIDSERIDLMLNVDPSRSMYRAGRWIRPLD